MIRSFLAIVMVVSFGGCEDTPKESVETPVVQQEVAKEVTKAPEPKLVTAPKEVTEPAQLASAIVSTGAAEGEKIYNSRCVSCHGKKGEKKAMNASAAIGGWKAVKTAKALVGYKDGTYGGKLKNLMKGQASKLSCDDVSKVARYISTLK